MGAHALVIAGDCNLWLESMSFLETTRKWFIFTILISFTSIFVHTAGQTGGFKHGYFEEPNLYHVWPRFDEITHPLSSCAVTSILLNLNLPMTYRKKWIISLVFGMVFGFIWEILEFIVAPMGFVKITLVDTLMDLHQDFYGSALAVLVYTIIMRESRVPTLTKFRL